MGPIGQGVKRLDGVDYSDGYSFTFSGTKSSETGGRDPKISVPRNPVQLNLLSLPRLASYLAPKTHGWLSNKKTLTQQQTGRKFLRSDKNATDIPKT